MKAIPDSVYEALSAEERVRAAVEAQARDDDAELERLKRTCPRKVLRCTDPAYSDTMDDLFRVAVVVESDLRGLALSYLASLRNPKNWPDSDLLQEEAVAVAIAWETILEERGIDAAVMEKALPLRHPYVKALLKTSEGMEMPEKVERCLADLKAGFH